MNRHPLGIIAIIRNEGTLFAVEGTEIRRASQQETDKEVVANLKEATELYIERPSQD